MLRRFFGLIIILKAFLPLLLIVAVGLIGWQVALEVREVIDEPLGRIQASAREIRQTVEEAQRTAEDVRQNVDEMVERTEAINESLNIELGSITEWMGLPAGGLAGALGGLFGKSEQVEPKETEIGGTFDVLGLGQVKGVLLDLGDILKGLSDLTGITTVSAEVRTMNAEARSLGLELWTIAQRWGPWVIGVAIAAGVIWLLAYLETFFREVARGWAMLRGRPDPWVVGNWSRDAYARRRR